MVRAMSSVTRARARSVAEGTMADTCEVITTTAAAPNASGYVARSVTATVSSACGVQWLATADQYTAPESGDRSSVVVVGTLRLPLALWGMVKATSRLRITAMRGDTLSTPIVVEIVGEPRRGTVAVVADIRRITL